MSRKQSQMTRQPSLLTISSTNSPTPSNLSVATGGNDAPAEEKPVIPMPVSRRESAAMNRRKSQHYERVKRRITRVNPNVTIQDITKPTRTAIPDKKLQPNRSAVFHFHCEGDMKVDEIKGTTTHIEWTASFDKPIEQLIYPSLQRFDLEAFEDKLKKKNQLHGHSQPSTSSNMYHIHNLSTKSKALTVLSEPTPVITNDGVTIDFLPNMDKVNPQLMYIHTPKWTGKVTIRSNNNSPTRPIQTPTTADLSFQSDGSSTKGHDKDDDSQSQQSRSPTKMNDSTILDSNENSPSKGMGSISSTFQKEEPKSFLEAVESIGEQHLREKIREKYQFRQEINRKEKELDLLASSPFHIEAATKSKFPVIQPPKLDPGDELYSTLLARTTAINQGVQQALTKLTDLSPEEIAYGEQAKFIRTSTPITAQYLQNGVLYYRMQSQLHNARLKELEALNQRKMTTISTRSSMRRYSTTFSKRLEQRKASVSTINVNQNVISLKNDDSNMLLAAKDIKILPEIQEISFHRINRAVNSKLATMNDYISPPRSPSAKHSQNNNEGVGYSSTASVTTSATLSSLPPFSPLTMKSANSKNFQSIKQSKGVFGGIEKEVNDQQKTKYNDIVGELWAPMASLFSAEIVRREVQDKLLLAQLDAGLLPESFIKKQKLVGDDQEDNDEENDGTVVNLSKYGIGDERGLCLGKCLSGLIHLQSIGLSDNRLTSVSLPTIIMNLNVSTVMHLDLSFNDMHEAGAKALAHYFSKNSNNIIRYLDLCNCSLTDNDIKTISNALHYRPNQLEELYLASNKFGDNAVSELCEYLSNANNCHLNILDLSWNNIGEAGAIDFSFALRNNDTLVKLNLSSNSINDHGGQRLLDSLTYHKRLKELFLAQNSLSTRTCFVVAQVLKNHVSMGRLDLSLNPLGEAGARSIFRTILNGLKCFVTMRNCTYNEDTLSTSTLSKVMNNPSSNASIATSGSQVSQSLANIQKYNNFTFQYSQPGLHNPYQLDLSEPYARSIMMELLEKFAEDAIHCNFENVFYNPTMGNQSFTAGSSSSVVNSIASATVKASASADVNVQFHIVETVHGRRVCLKGYEVPWQVPLLGVIRFTFQQASFVPSLSHTIRPVALETLQIIVENGITEQDKKNWLLLLCQDLYFTTEQAQSIINRFKRKRTIGAGGLTILDILKSLWKYLIDTENMFDFLFANTDSEQRKDLVYALTLKRYKFNWSNPTSHWTLSLGDKIQRSIINQLVAINNVEAEFGKFYSKRQDTSQMGNWYNFRNTKFTHKGETNEVTIDKDFIKNLPLDGTLDFDYVSTTRPPIDVITEEEEEAIEQGKNNNKNFHDDYPFFVDGGLSNPTSSRSRPPSNKTNNNNSSSRPVSNKSTKGTGNIVPSSRGYTPYAVYSSAANLGRRKIYIISDEQLYEFMKQLGLSNRNKISASQALFILMDLQLASTKYYFLVHHVLILLDAFTEEWDIQSKVIVLMFSRVKDIHNMDLVLRQLGHRAQQDILKRLGVLNVMNPLKIGFDYIFCLKYLDNRILLISLMELASIESADQIIEDPTTELPIATLYGSYTRALNDSRPEIMKFTYNDFGVRTNNVSWSSRKDLLKKFLIGTHPIDEEVYKVINQFKEMEQHNALSTGPIDLQYASYLKNKSQKQSQNNSRHGERVKLTYTPAKELREQAAMAHANSSSNANSPRNDLPSSANTGIKGVMNMAKDLVSIRKSANS